MPFQAPQNNLSPLISLILQRRSEERRESQRQRERQETLAIAAAQKQQARQDKLALAGDDNGALYLFDRDITSLMEPEEKG